MRITRRLIMLALAAVTVSCAAGCQQWASSVTNSWNTWVAQRRVQQPPSELQGKPKKEDKTDLSLAVARSLENHGQRDEAMRLYVEVVKTDTKRAEAAHRLALLYDKKGDIQASQKYYEIAVKRAPKNAELLCDYGYSCYLQRRWADAEMYLRKALEVNPESARAHNNLGLVLARNDRLEEALSEFAKAGCDEAAARSNLGFALLSNGRFDDARVQFEWVVANKPSLAPAQEALAQIRARAGAQAGFAPVKDSPSRQQTVVASAAAPRTR